MLMEAMGILASSPQQSLLPGWARRELKRSRQKESVKCPYIAKLPHPNAFVVFICRISFYESDQRTILLRTCLSEAFRNLTSYRNRPVHQTPLTFAVSRR